MKSFESLNAVRIIQAASRLNREHEWGLAEVEIWHVHNETSGKLLASQRQLLAILHNVNWDTGGLLDLKS